MRPEVLMYEDEHIIVYARKMSGRLVISFNEMGYGNLGESWGSKLFHDMNVSSVGFVSKRPNWFPARSVEKAHMVIAQFITDHDHVLTYGHSQGGYAATKYAGVLGADTILSFCPQISIDPADVTQQDPRFIGFFTNKEDHQIIVSADIPKKAHLFVFYDPTHHHDRYNAELMLGMSQTSSAIKIVGTGHSSLRPFASLQKMQKLMELAMNRDVHNLRMHALESKRTWPPRAVYLARSAARRRPHLAASLVDKYQSLLNDEVCPELVHHLYNGLLYNYLSDNYEKFIRFLAKYEVDVLHRSLLAADNLHGARLVNEYSMIRFGGDKRPVAELSLQIFYQDSSWVNFAEGWSSPEQWGIWGTSIRSRIYVDWGKIPNHINELFIGCAPFYMHQQSLAVSALDDCAHLYIPQQVAGGVKIVRSGRISRIDFRVDRLLSPAKIGTGNDGRLLGVKLSKPSTWFSAFGGGQLL